MNLSSLDINSMTFNNYNIIGNSLLASSCHFFKCYILNLNIHVSDIIKKRKIKQELWTVYAQFQFGHRAIYLKTGKMQ